MSLAGLFGRKADKKAAHDAYGTAVLQARTPTFYALYHVPDTLDGRFEMVAIHVFMILHRVKSDKLSGAFAQMLFDVFFADMDRGLRELGTGDLSVGKQIKLMATGFYGRIAAYESGLAGNEDLDAALRRNLYGTVSEPDLADLAFMAAYLRQQVESLASQPIEAIRKGLVRFVPIQPNGALP